jgi:hypothetical protein
VLETAIETRTRNARDRELNRKHIAHLAARIVTRNLVNGGNFTIRKVGGVEARRLMRFFVEPEADRVLVLHVRVLRVPDQGERRLASLPNHIAGRDRVRTLKRLTRRFSSRVPP